MLLPNNYDCYYNGSQVLYCLFHLHYRYGNGLLVSIPYDEVRQLASVYKEINELVVAILEFSLILSQHKADMLRFESAKQRYLRTLEENPELIRRTPVHYIASYLQVRPETLSRVRTNVMNSDNK